MSSKAFDIRAAFFLAFMLIGSGALALDSASHADEV